MVQNEIQHTGREWKTACVKVFQSKNKTNITELQTVRDEVIMLHTLMRSTDFKMAVADLLNELVGKNSVVTVA